MNTYEVVCIEEKVGRREKKVDYLQIAGGLHKILIPVRIVVHIWTYASGTPTYTTPKEIINERLQ